MNQKPNRGSETARIVTVSPYMSEIRLDDYELPVPRLDVERVADILRKTDVFCTGPTAGDIYNWEACRKTHADGVKTVALIDRNILNDVVTLAQTAIDGLAGPLPERARMGAAVMAYLLCCNVLIDPGIAVREWPADAVEKLTLFRRADEADAAIYVDIALERAHSFTAADLPPARVQPTAESVAGNIPGLEEYRLAVLKIANLELSSLSPDQKMESFIDWSFNDFVFLPAAIALAAQQFAPSRAKPVLRKIRSANRQLARSAADNAVWDLVVAMHWAERVIKQLPNKEFWILCSRDAALKQLAKNLHFSQDAGQSREGMLRSMLVDLWGSSNGKRLSKHVLALMFDKGNPARSCNRTAFKDRISMLRRELEEEFLEWEP